MMQFGPLTLKRCRYGWMLFGGGYIGKCFDLYGEYSEAEVAVMRRFVRPGDTVIDVGAHIGDLTLPLAQIVGPQGRVYAIESHADVFNVLCSNLALNQILNVHPINAFLRHNSSAPIREDFVKAGGLNKITEIDSLGIDDCRLIKIDVDGNELEVIQSAKRTIKRSRPILYFENDIRDLSKNLLEHAFSLDYRLFWHVAPLFSPLNFFDNPINHWHPNGIISLMVLGLPRESGLIADDLREIRDANEWWDGTSLQPLFNYPKSVVAA